MAYDAGIGLSPAVSVSLSVSVSEQFFEFRRHSRVPMSSGGLDASPIRIPRAVLVTELAKRVPESAPGIALVVRAGQVCAELLGGLAPLLEFLVLECEAEPCTCVVRVALEHAL